MSFSLRTTLAAAALATCTVLPAHAALVYSLASDGSVLVRFDTAAPALVTTVGAIGGATTFLDGMDFRPADGKLYGYSNTTDSVYTVDTATGNTTLVSTLTTPTSSFTLGIDFNPVPDRLRIVTDTAQNLRVNVATGATTVDGTLAYAAGDVNFGAAPQIVDVAYTNSDTSALTGTVLYYIDAAANTLVSTTNPNGGTLNTVGALGLDVDEFTGFDILTNLGLNTAYATFRIGGSGGPEGLYTINLASGAASLVGAVTSQLMYGLAIVPGITASATVAEPGVPALLAAAGLAAFALRRRRTAHGAA